MEIELTAISFYDETGKIYWQLMVATNYNGNSQRGYFYGARGEPRRYYHLNALYQFCAENFGNCKYISIEIKPMQEAKSTH
jgi:hypothetical protein